MPNPTRAQILNAHEALKKLGHMAWNGSEDMYDKRLCALWKKQILAALPPRPRPTMAEVEWDNEKHCLAEAEHPGWGKVIMLGIGEEKLIDVFIPHLRKSNCIVPRGNLTPTGKRYELKEIQE